METIPTEFMPSRRSVLTWAAASLPGMAMPLKAQALGIRTLQKDLERPFRLGIVGVGAVGAALLNLLRARGMCGPHADSLLSAGFGWARNERPQVRHRVMLVGEPSESLFAARQIEGCDMVVLVSGLGGQRTTETTLGLAALARRAGALTVTFSTLPATYEGALRRTRAMAALASLKRTASSVFAYPLESWLDWFCDLPSGLTLERFYDLIDNKIARDIASLCDLVAVPAASSAELNDRLSPLASLGVACIGSSFCLSDDECPNVALLALDGAVGPQYRFLPGVVDQISVFRMRSNTESGRAKWVEELEDLQEAMDMHRVPSQVREVVFPGYRRQQQALALVRLKIAG